MKALPSPLRKQISADRASALHKDIPSLPGLADSEFSHWPYKIKFAAKQSYLLNQQIGLVTFWAGKQSFHTPNSNNKKKRKNIFPILPKLAQELLRPKHLSEDYFRSGHNWLQNTSWDIARKALQNACVHK